MPKKSLQNIGRESPGTETLEQLTGRKSKKSNLSAEGSRASRSVVPGSSEARQMTVTSGLKLCDALTLSGPLGSLARMCLGSLRWHSTRCALIWKVSATPSGRSVYRLVRSMPRTNANESGLWPTATNRDYKGASGAGRQARKGHPADTLPNAVKMWPTPSANNQAGGCTGLNGGSGARAKLREMVGRDMQLQMSGGQLNPTWVEWLMGYPLGWTDLGDSATPLSRKSPRH